MSTYRILIELWIPKGPINAEGITRITYQPDHTLWYGESYGSKESAMIWAAEAKALCRKLIKGQSLGQATVGILKVERAGALGTWDCREDHWRFSRNNIELIETPSKRG